MRDIPIESDAGFPEVEEPRMYFGEDLSGYKIVDTNHQSVRLQGAIGQSELRVLPGLGHMIHYFATDQVVSAIDGVAARASALSRRLAA